jgi:SAM-dependent methyltransferase
LSRKWRLRLALYGVLAAVLAGGAYLALRYADPWRGEPGVIFDGTPPEAVEKMLELAGVTKDDVVYDLGCGDGRIPIAAAKKYGCRAVGVELRDEVYAAAVKNVADNKLGHLVEIRKGDLYETDLSGCTVLCLYLLPDMNVKLLPQIEKMKPGSRVVSFKFDMNTDDANSVKEKVVQLKFPNGSERTIYLWRTPIRFEMK